MFCNASVPWLIVVVPVKLFAADRVSVPAPFLISPAEPATVEPRVALTPEAAVRVGEMPLRFSVPLCSV